jgi:cytidylate kinase
MLDERTKGEAKKGSVVIDAQLGAWMVKDLADVKVLLTAPDDVRFGRIARRDRIEVEDARKETEYREAVQKRRYKKYYGIDVDDLSIYDITIDTSLHTIEETKRIILESVRGLLRQRANLKEPS